ncbi:hypothetical protein CLAIMM_03638 [Cladophialophora immunda]|nr:hypothetical protein CLAIMM_03638 [Cladophialophora immunda]
MALSPPASYATLPVRHIKVCHVPESSPTPTPVILIQINRPEILNAFTDWTREDLELVYSLADVDPRVKCLVLTGSGKAFCAGMDLQMGLKAAKKGQAGLEGQKEREVDHRDSCSKPTIAAINGAAVGVGITMCLPASIRVAYAKAKIGFVFGQRGLVMEACSSFFLPRLIGHSRAIFLTSTGAVYPAESPHFGSLFADILPSPEATLARALELAHDMVTKTSIVSNKLMRDLMYRGPDSAEEAHLLDSKVIHGLFGKKDNMEGMQSFLEKRAATFTGSLPDDGPDVYPWWRPIDVGVNSQLPNQGPSPNKAKL